MVTEGRGLRKSRSPSMGHFQAKQADAQACKVEGKVSSGPVEPQSKIHNGK